MTLAHDYYSEVPSGSVTVIGIGADGYDGLGDRARTALAQANYVLGSWRQLNLLPDSCTAVRRPWPSPMLPALPGIFESLRGKDVVVLGSGDPMFHGIGTTLSRLLGPDAITVISSASSASLACARLGWALNTTPISSLLTKPVESLALRIDDGIPFLVLCRDSHSPQDVCEYLVEHGHGDARVDLLSDLGSEQETHTTSTADRPEWLNAESDLAILAVAPTHAGYSRAPGRPDSCYANDGQLTKADMRALTIAALAPRPGELLWDIGGGSGSISIEWCRVAENARAIAIERDHARAARITSNSLGYPVRVVLGEAPDVLTDLTDLAGAKDSVAPDAVFIGGGLTVPGVVDTAWEALKPGGRFVANAVTLESERLVHDLHDRWGGSLTRVEISQAKPLGGFHTWRPALPVVRYVVSKPSSKTSAEN